MNFKVIMASISILLLLSACSQEATPAPAQNVEPQKTEAPKAEENENKTQPAESESVAESAPETKPKLEKLVGLSSLAGIGSTLDNLKDVHGEVKKTNPQANEVTFNDDSSAVMEGDYAKSVNITVSPAEVKSITREDAKKLAKAFIPTDAKIVNEKQTDGYTVVEFSSELLANSPFKTKECYIYVFHDSIGVISYGGSVGKWGTF